MKNLSKIPLGLWLLGLQLLTSSAFGQTLTIKLANGASQSLQPAGLFKPTAPREMTFDGHRYAVVHFKNRPPANWGKGQTVQIMVRLTELDFVVSFDTNPTASDLLALGITHIGEPQRVTRLSEALLKGQVSPHAKQADGQMRLLVAVHSNVSENQLMAWAKTNGLSFRPLAMGASTYAVMASSEQLQLIAAQPFVAYVQPANPPDQPLNQNVRSASRAMSLNAPLVSGGRNLLGQGIVAGVGDDADPSLHPDLTDRIIERSFGITNNHGTHVTGTVAGGGIMQDTYKGMAPLATVITQFFSGIWEYALQYVQDFDMVVANHSYAHTAGECYYNGVYDLYSNVLDGQALSMPHLLHVFAAGNSGDDVCAPFPANFGTVLGSYQSAKNTVCVGRADLVQVASQGSSVGPVKDGRIKPDLVVLGELTSTWGPDDYRTELGTSMSAPAATGGLVLLNQRYRELHGTKPRGDLMKNLLLNGARDIGNAGPDFKAGFGLMHLENSLRMLEQNRYTLSTVAQNATQSQVITVPAGTAALKVMLYWHDLPANPLATNTLVNDLDLEVITPSNTTIFPKRLDPSPSQASMPATEGVDHINNVEQVVILNPAPGNYTVRTTGYAVSVVPTQNFTITYDFLPTAMHISAPFAGSSWPTGEAIPVSWDDEGTTPNTFTLDYSIDNGVNWVLAEANIPANQRYRGLVFPNGTATSQARIRLSKSGAPSVISGQFTVVGTPNHALAPNAEQCSGYIKLNWGAVTGADDYELIMKEGPVMVSKAVVSSATLSYSFSGLNPDSIYFVAVRARKNGMAGRHNYAAIRRPNTGTCGGGISDGDLRLDSIVAPQSGRLFTSSALTNAQNLVLRIRNHDDVAINAFDLKYSINGGPLTVVPVAAPIAAGGTYTHVIAGLDLLATGNYDLLAIVKNTHSVDNVAANDSFRVTVRQLPNLPITLTGTPLVENFDASAATTLSRQTIGIDNLTAWDYFNFDRRARARTFVNSGIAQSGNRAITLDVSKAPPTLVTPGNLLVGTFNLSPHTVANEVRADFSFASHGSLQLPHPTNKVWARGSEVNAWVEVYDLGANQGQFGVWKKSPSLEISDALQAAGQNFSTSTQLRFGQWAQFGMADATHLAGYSFDDVRLYLAENDVQVLSIDTPSIYSCGLNQTVPIRATVRNSMQTALNNIPISYTINGGPPVNEVIPNIPANSSLIFTFSTGADLQSFGSYNLVVFTTLPGDNVLENNSVTAVVRNQAIISSFPYIENFESGNGSFFVTGTNASWQYGTPASLIINTAASGTNAWKTTLAGDYKSLETSYLNSPCFNTVGLQNPTLSFSMAYDLEDCSPFGVVCDAAWVEYSSDGKVWTKLGASGQGTNWYDNANANVWLKRRQSHWHVATIPLPANIQNLRLRFVMRSDEYTTYEGVAIDDIHIYSNTAPMYVSNVNSAAVLQNLSGNTLTSFADAGQMLGSVNPEGANMGSTEGKIWMYTGPVRVFQNQYYGSRTLTIKPSSNPLGSKTVRYYFSDAEANVLRNATGCGSCTPPKDFSEMAITQYTNNNKALEDGDLANNTGGAYTFYDDVNVDFVPYDKGYYAEFSVDSFSEFWLNDGNVGLVLPIDFDFFTAIKLNSSSAKLEWQAKDNGNQHLYNVEVAVGDDAAVRGRFEKVATLLAESNGSGRFAFVHDAANTTGRLYYRIQQVSKDGKLSYSAVRSLHFGNETITIKTFPNPAKGKLSVVVSGVEAAATYVSLTNLQGQRLISRQLQLLPREGEQTLTLPLTGIAAGVYFLTVENGGQVAASKIIVQ